MRIQPSDFFRPVVFFKNGIGDSILTLPALRALAALFAKKLTLVCDREIYRVLLSDIPASCMVPLELLDEGTPNPPRDFDAVTLSPKLAGCDLFISLVPWRSKSLVDLIRRLRPKVSIGFFPDYVIAVPLDFGKHAADLAFDIPKLFSPHLLLEDFSEPPRLPERALSTISMIDGLITAGTKLLAVHTETTPQKSWGSDKFNSLVAQFLIRHPNFTVIEIALERRKLRSNDRIACCLGLPLDFSLSLIGRADLFVGIDSCMLHAADFFRVPGVGLFAPTSCVEWGFRVGPHRHVVGKCTMDTIAVNDVLEALESLWDESAR